MDARRVLTDVAAYGPFFVVGTDPAEAADPTWRPVRDLHHDPAPLRERIAHVRRTLGSDDRVAGSIAFLGLAAQLVAAPFAAAVEHDVLLDLTPQQLHWRPVASGPWPLWCPDPSAVAGPGTTDALRTALVEGHLAPLVAAVRARVAVSEQVLWGNAASSIAAAKRVVVSRREDLADRAAAVAATLLAAEPLAGTGELRRPAGPDRVWSFRRRSCCLYYRVPGGGLCEDCVLVDRPARR